jgi:uncharacterized membrane protein
MFAQKMHKLHNLFNKNIIFALFISRWGTLGLGSSGPIVFKTMKSENKNIANYVNHVMSELNSLSTDLYEAMMDQENDEVKKIVETMIPILKDIQSTHTNEIV